MYRRRYLTLAAAVTAGCTGRNSTGLASSDNETQEQVDTSTSDTPATIDEPEDETESDESDEEEIVPPDEQPITDYELEVIDERWGAHPVWIDQDEYVYGRGANRLIGSPDWWHTTETLYEFGDSDTVRAVVVPDSGNVIVGIQDRDEGRGRVEVLDSDFEEATTAYQFDYGTPTHSVGHVTYEDIVLIGSYGLSEFDNNRHANEVILSTDGGETFDRILEVPLNSKSAANLHIHDVEWDPYAERIWVAVGDHGNSQIYWSDDLGDSWATIDEQGKATQPTQVVAFEDSIVFGTDSAPEGILRWGRESPSDEPSGVEDIERPYVAIEDEPDDQMRYWAQRRWHVREDDRELCLMPFRYSRHETWRQSVVLGTVDGKEWYELYRTDDERIMFSNVMGPVSLDGDRRVLVSDSTRNDGYLLEAKVPAFWE